MPFSSTRRSRLILLLVDGVTVNLAWIVYFYFRVQSGLFELNTSPELLLPMAVIGGFWFLLFWIFGLYRPHYAQSRFDEFTLVVKTITVGVLILFFLVFVDDAMQNDPGASRTKIVLYWGFLILFVGAGRMAFRSIRRRMLVVGIGRRRTLIIGPRDAARELHATLVPFPALGYDLLGAVTLEPEKDGDHPLPILGALADLETLVLQRDVEEIILCLDSSDHELLLDIIGRCSAFKVGIKIRPDLYDIVSGQARTNQLYGIPLIEVTPQLMAPWEEFVKRTLDVTVSLLALVLGSPLFLLIALGQKLTSRGPVFYRQERVGKDGKVFWIHKFRTMYTDAEKRGGPQWAQKDDPRVTPFGRFLRKTHLDELPQFFNVLEGDMSLVGPRPERPYFVEQFIKEIPLYRRRLNVRPGITGWAQVKYGYDQTIEDVKAKLRYDLFYIENLSLRMDLKILLSTVYTMIAGKGQA